MTRTHMAHERMVITEEWRWRLLTIWVIAFSLLVAYVLFKVHDVAQENRDALCSIRQAHLATDKALKLLLDKGGLDAGSVTAAIQEEHAALMELGCDEP